MDKSIIFLTVGRVPGTATALNLAKIMAVEFWGPRKLKVEVSGSVAPCFSLEDKGLNVRTEPVLVGSYDEPYVISMNYAQVLFDMDESTYSISVYGSDVDMLREVLRYFAVSLND